MTARHAAQTPPCAAPRPLTGHPAPGDVLRAAASALPTTDPRGWLTALAREYDLLDDTTDERLVRMVAADRGWSENYTRLVLGIPVRGEVAS